MVEPNSILHDGQLYTDPKSIANIFNNYFSKICSSDYSNPPKIIQKMENIPILSPLSITVNELALVINKLFVSKAIGIDNINVNILKLAGDINPFFIALIFLIHRNIFRSLEMCKSHFDIQKW